MHDMPPPPSQTDTPKLMMISTKSYVSDYWPLFTINTYPIVYCRLCLAHVTAYYLLGKGGYVFGSVG